MFSALKRFASKRESDDLARAYARLFQTPDGRIVLEHLHHQVLFRITDPLIPYEQLRFLEGQKQLVLFICQMAAKAH